MLCKKDINNIYGLVGMVRLDYKIVGHSLMDDGQMAYFCDLLVNGEYIDEFTYVDEWKDWDEINIPYNLLEREWESMKNDYPELKKIKWDD